MKMIEYIKEHSSIYDEWLVKVVGNLKVSDGFKSISVPDNILELWNIMSENPSQMEKKIDELTPHNIGMPEEEKLMCAIVSRYIWEKLSRDQYDHDATSESLTLTFKLTYEEILPPYLAMSEYLSKGRKTKKAEQKMAHIKTAG
ncbi:hypothetical protein KM043_018837 [Ampulex compressa]|nr:hypothetical protein KM043_018837 [Ampulex compressa]